MIVNRSNMIFGGLPSSGKTAGAIEFCDTFANYKEIKDYNVMFLDFENPRGGDCLEDTFPEIGSHFEVWDMRAEAIEKQNTQLNKVVKKDLFADFAADVAIDYLQTYYNLKDSVIPTIKKEIKNYDALIVDGLLGTPGREIAKAYWWSQNEERKGMAQLDQAELKDFELKAHTAFRMAARNAKIPVIFTAQMKDDYAVGENKVATKTGKTVYKCSYDVIHESTMVIELVQPIASARPGSGGGRTFKVNCKKTSVKYGQTWSSQYIPGERNCLMY